MLNSRGAIAVTRRPLVFHSTFELGVHGSVCLPLSCLSYFLPRLPLTSRHLHLHTTNFPPSAAIVTSLPSTGPLIWLRWDVPGLYLTGRKRIPKPVYGLLIPLTHPSLFLFPPSLHLLLPLGFSPCILSLLQLESYLFHCLQEWILAPLPTLLSLLILPLSVRLDPPNPPLYPSPARPVATAVLLQFMGSLQRLPVVERKERGGKTRTGETQQRRDVEIRSKRKEH